MRALFVSILALGLTVTGCGSSAPKKATPGSEGTGGMDEPTGGSTGTGGVKGTGGSTGGSTGSGGTSSTGGALGSGGSGGSGGGTGGAPASTPDAAADGPASATTDGPRGIPGHEWVLPCLPEWTRDQCCMHYCTCMMTNCASRAPANCLATCTAPGNNWNLKCKVEQCFESLDPRYPMDHNSHCGHATEAAHCQGIIP
jgi:hypothetical protein